MSKVISFCFSKDKPTDIVYTGYIIGPIFGSILYDRLGYQWAYRGVSLVALTMAIIMRRCFVKHLDCTNRKEEFEIEEVDLEIQDVDVGDLQKGYEIDEQSSASTRRNCLTSHNTSCNNDNDTVHLEECNKLEPCDTSIPTTSSLLRHPKITCSALTILWISASWCFLEPILAKRLVQFDLGKLGIGVIFALSNLVYVPTAFFIQYIPMRFFDKHVVIAISILLTPIGVLFVGASSLPFMTLGVLLLGFFPTPVWILLLPTMQEDVSNLFSSRNHKRCVNDLTAGIYNLFITLGQIVGYVSFLFSV